jgi:glycosyltransferase involved in cell wall biosynthesis
MQNDEKQPARDSTGASAAVMRAFDVGVVPSRREAFGIAALELMRMQVPVIVSPVGGLPELIQDGETGVVLPGPAATEIANAIRRLREDACLRERLCRNAFEHAGLFDGREPLERLYHLYNSIMKRTDA